jgi:hypothetical protein
VTQDEGSGIDGLLAEIGRWRDDERAAAAATSRSRRRWLHQQLAESATLCGLLLTLGERGETVTIATSGGPLTGTITNVTQRLCAMDVPSGGIALIPIAAIGAVEARAEGITDDRVPASDLDLPAILASLVADRPPVTVHLAGGTAVSGRLTNVGVDLVTVGAATGEEVHVPIAAIAACLLA